MTVKLAENPASLTAQLVKIGWKSDYVPLLRALLSKVHLQNFNYVYAKASIPFLHILAMTCNTLQHNTLIKL